MSQAKNILFIMCDQLRFDYLSCYGHPHLHTPNIDRLANMGVRFERAYTQAPLCGPARASIGTGRYMSSHGVMSNTDPVRLGEKMMGEYMRELGVRPVSIGKLAFHPNQNALKRLSINLTPEQKIQLETGGFECLMRDDGLHPDPINDPNYDYNVYLRDLGYDAENGWDRNANSSIDPDGNIHSGWEMRSAQYPANIAEEHSETAYTTDCALTFLSELDHDQSWLLQLSYNKPHWPIIAPAPYHNMFGADGVIPAVKSDAEQQNRHPVYQAFMGEDFSENWSQEKVRECVIPVYMGLIKQIDDHIGRLLDYLERNDLFKNTMIVFTSDHGDYLGDHWLGEKDLFHEPSARVPLIVVDPDVPAAERGKTELKLVELIDLLPTFIDFMGGEIPKERLEGHSLRPLLHGETVPWRDQAISEIDYSDRGPRTTLNQHPHMCRAYMVRTTRWKYIYFIGYGPQLFDLENDPDEVCDLGQDPDYEAVRQQMSGRLFDWLLSLKDRPEVPATDLFNMGPELDESVGLMIGHW